MQDLFVGRQPIYSRELDLFAYELLYRGAYVDYADFSEGDRATSRVLLNTFTELGLERVVGDHLAFVNLTRGFIVGEYPLPVPHEHVVLEVLEDVPADDEVVAGLRKLRREGFRIALDDFLYSKENRRLLETADIVKLDILTIGPDAIAERVEELRPYGCQLLAEKIETRQQFEVCLDLGFDYFQGYFLARPNVVQGASIPPSRLNLLRLLAELQDPDCDLDRVQEIVSQDVTLSYKLLRHINSVIYGLARRIDSIRETVVYLGVGTVKNLASLFLLSDVRDTPHELVVTSMLRAKMCECMGLKLGLKGGSAFTVGLFSTLDLLMNAPMQSVVSQLPLSREVKQALVRGEGVLGGLLACAIAYEKGDWSSVGSFRLPASDVRGAFLEAVAWVESADHEISRMAS